MKDVLIVEPDPACRERLTRLMEVGDAVVTAVADFPAGRRWLEIMRPHVLVANLRLGEYNGLNLVLLADHSRTKSVVYVNTHDPGLARDVQETGAFYELLEALPQVLPSYVVSALPDHDRRDPQKYGQPRIRLVGRRSTDAITLH